MTSEKVQSLFFFNTNKTLRVYLPVLFSLMVLTACFHEQEVLVDRVALLNLQPLPPVKEPDDNISNPEKVTLGRMLFWDPILSGNKDVACVTCHHPDAAYADGLDLAIGVGGQGLGTGRVEDKAIPRVGRNSPTVLNTAYNGLTNRHQDYSPEMAPAFWDNRTFGLEAQSLGPPLSFNEMRGDAYTPEAAFDTLVRRLKNIPAYVTLFREAFRSANSITKKNIGKAIAAFERTLTTHNSAYDRFVRGDKAALDEAQQRGLMLFHTKGNCAACHSGPMFSDYTVYNLGIRPSPVVGTDKGVNGQFKFRTPSLRNIELTAPYMHNGTHETLEEVMDYYNAGLSENEDIPRISHKIKPLRLSPAEVSDIIAFMKSLTDAGFDKTVPASVPSGLKPGGNI